MKATRGDYDRALEGFVARMRELGSDLKSILLYGSVARTDFSPGKSDLLDAYVFVSQRALKNREGYRRVVKQLVKACKAVGESGLPYRHPAHFYGDEETAYIPAEFLPELASDDHSKILWGEDPRASFPTEDAIYGARFEEIRQYCILTDAWYLARDELTVKERATLAKLLGMWFGKLVLVWACSSVSQPTPAPAASNRLQELFPDVDFTVVDAVRGLREREDGPPETRELKELLRKGLAFTEELYRRFQAVGFQ